MVTAGSIKLAVPTSTARAPAIRNSNASAALQIPPNPTTGILTAWATCHTMRTATGLTQGPLRPPVMVLKYGRCFSTSMAIPNNVLMSDTLSAPASSTALAISTTLVTLGVSLTIIVLPYTLRTALTTLAAISGLVPNPIPPFLTLGQLILSSMAG